MKVTAGDQPQSLYHARFGETLRQIAYEKRSYIKIHELEELLKKCTHCETCGGAFLPKETETKCRTCQRTFPHGIPN